MNARTLQRGVIVIALLSAWSSVGMSALYAADVQADFAATTEAVIGNDRVVLLSVTRFTEFVTDAGGNRPRAVAALRVMYLRERLGERPNVLTASEVDVFAAGTNDKPFRFAGNSHTTAHASKNYGGYVDWLKRQSDEWSTAKLPAVKDAGAATVAWVTFHDVQMTATHADVKVKVGDGVVAFKNIPLE
ncbi:MAG: hypothetical protein QM775_05700 [Pirellulales bacterium]